MPPTLSYLLRAFGPAVPPASPKEALRAGCGALIGLGFAGLFVFSPAVDPVLGLYMIAPFGASSVLVFAVPNSPLAQPWPTVVGNTLAALIGVAVCLTVPDPSLRIALAVGLSILAMTLCRAVHPPAGAVAMTAAMSPEAISELGFRFALTPVALGSVLLILIAIPYARATGRHYPLRQFDDRNAHGTEDPDPVERIGLDREELSDLLAQYRQSLNLGVEDLARLIGAAEMRAAGHRAEPVAAKDIMSTNLVTVGPEAPLGEIVDQFRTYNFTSIPVVEGGDRYLGIIFQMHLIARGRDDALRLNRGFAAAMARLLDGRGGRTACARDVMGVAGPRATPTTPIAALLPLMAGGDCDAVPVLHNGRILGIVTQTDLIAALARTSLQPDRTVAQWTRNDDASDATNQ